MFNKMKRWWNRKKGEVPWSTLIVVVITLVVVILFFIGRKIWTTLLK